MIYKSISLSYNCSHRSLFKMYLVWAHTTGLTPPFFALQCLIKPGEWLVMCLCVKVIEFSCFYDSSIKFWNCSDSMVFWNCSDSVLFCFWFHYLEIFFNIWQIKVITKLPNSEQSYKGKVQTHNYINRQNQSTTGKLWKP